MLELWEIVYERHIAMKNPREAGRILITGTTFGGRILTFSLEPTEEAGTWRPVTGWPATRAEVTLFEKHVQ